LRDAVHDTLSSGGEMHHHVPHHHPLLHSSSAPSLYHTDVLSAPASGHSNNPVSNLACDPLDFTWDTKSGTGLMSSLTTTSPPRPTLLSPMSPPASPGQKGLLSRKQLGLVCPAPVRQRSFSDSNNLPFEVS
jgi:hypothetical protein